MRADNAVRAVHQFCEHYDREEKHQALDNKFIDPDSGSDGACEVQCCKRPGVLLRYYRDAG